VVFGWIEEGVVLFVGTTGPRTITMWSSWTRAAADWLGLGFRRGLVTVGSS
jgi:hypothetical protein